MNKVFVLGFLLLITLSVLAQYKDLIVTNDGNSIACEIIEVKDYEVFLNIIYDSRNVQIISRDEIANYEYDVIQEDVNHNKTDTSYDKGYSISSKMNSFENLQNASKRELEYYQFKAEKLKRTGRIMLGAGACSIVLGFTLREAVGNGFQVDNNKDAVMNTAAIMVITGAVTTLVALPIYFIGASRASKINQINRICDSAIHLDLNPNIHYNIYTQNYQSGLTLSIGFN